MKKLKRLMPDIICVALFAIISLVYFYPADFQGRRLSQHDNGAADGLGVEINQYRDQHDGETPRWTNSVFGGMPTYQIAPSYESTKGMSFIEKAYHLWLPDYVFYIFISMLGFYILLRAFDFKQWMAALGAIVWAFSSYFFIIIAAGHIWKVLTLAYIPPTIAGIVLCYKKRYLVGCCTLAFFAALQIMSNHVQMTYYFLIPEILIVIAFLINAIKNKETKSFIKGTIAIIIAAIIAVGINASNLFHTYEYAKDTMRGKSELVKQGKTDDQTDSGLERSYITAWSYGIAETWSLLIPNINGGASVPLSMNEKAMSKSDAELANAKIYDAFTQYWGEQPGTSGPVYVGALVCMLFVLSLFILSWKSPIKWALLLSTIISIMLAWGKNFMPLTDFCIDYIPMYSKFRTVASILVVAEFTIPLLALLGLKEFVERCKQNENRGKLLRALILSTVITLACCFIFIFSPSSVFNECVSSNDRTAISQYIQAGYFDEGMGARILSSISAMRENMLVSDAWRSVRIIIIGAVVMFFIYKKRKDTFTLALVMIGICLIDMWDVNKRYLNDGMFGPDTRQSVQNHQPADWENYIIGKSGDKRNYRVLNFAVSTFNDNTTSFCFSSVGGYHAAKLRRYQELVEEHISKEMQGVYGVLGEAKLDTTAMMQAGISYPLYNFEGINTDSIYPVLNMLNTKWFVMGGQDNIKIPIENPDAYGNAWFVDDVKYVDNANEELAALHKVNPRHTAVIDRQQATNIKATADSTASIKQVSLTCDEVQYDVNSKKGGLVVFSEIYYPGWTATIDGNEANIIRANYVLRAMEVPAGKHTIKMEFHPQTVKTTETIANISFYSMLIIAVVAYLFGRKKKEN